MKASYSVVKLGSPILISSFLSFLVDFFFFKHMKNKRVGNQPDALYMTAADIFS